MYLAKVQGRKVESTGSRVVSEGLKLCEWVWPWIYDPPTSTPQSWSYRPVRFVRCTFSGDHIQGLVCANIILLNEPYPQPWIDFFFFFFANIEWRYLVCNLFQNNDSLKWRSLISTLETVTQWKCRDKLKKPPYNVVLWCINQNCISSMHCSWVNASELVISKYIESRENLLEATTQEAQIWFCESGGAEVEKF